MITCVERVPRFQAFYYERRTMLKLIEELCDRGYGFAYERDNDNFKIVHGDDFYILNPGDYFVVSDNKERKVYSSSEFHEAFEWRNGIS